MSKIQHLQTLPLHTYMRGGVTAWFIFILVTGTLGTMAARSTRTGTPYIVTITTSNFRTPLLAAPADDLSDPGHAQFSLQNGTPLWYSMNIQSTPAGITPTAANASSDLVSTTFLGPIALLPPAQVLPFDQWNNRYHFEQLRLKLAFSGPGQQVQLELVPTEPHAITLDILTLLLQLLGQHANGLQIGLLATGELADIFAITGAMKDFNTLVGNYSQALTAPDANAVLASAYACALNIASLLSDGSEQVALANLLWKLEGKSIPQANILKTITDLAQTQFGLAIEGYIHDTIGTMGAMVAQQTGNPSVLLQTTSTATPSVTASLTPSPMLTPTQSPRITPSLTTYPPNTPQHPSMLPTQLPTRPKLLATPIP